METLLQDVVKNSSDPENFDQNYNLAITFLRRSEGSSFSIPDFNADADAVNLYDCLKGASLSYTFKTYYADKNKMRYTSFCNSIAGPNNTGDLRFLYSHAYDYVATDYTSVGHNSPLLTGYTWTSTQGDAVARAFKDRCLELIESED